MKLIAQWNQKGGVGKTTATESIGAGLTKRGFKTLMIDADPQGNLTTWLAPENAGADLSIVIEGWFNPEDAIYPVENNLFILPAAENLSLREVEFGKLSNEEIGHENQ